MDFAFQSDSSFGALPKTGVTPITEKASNMAANASHFDP
jgi:hypothetical protein